MLEYHMIRSMFFFQGVKMAIISVKIPVEYFDEILTETIPTPEKVNQTVISLSGKILQRCDQDRLAFTTRKSSWYVEWFYVNHTILDQIEIFDWRLVRDNNTTTIYNYSVQFDGNADDILLLKLSSDLNIIII